MNDRGTLTSCLQGSSQNSVVGYTNNHAEGGGGGDVGSSDQDNSTVAEGKEVNLQPYIDLHLFSLKKKKDNQLIRHLVCFKVTLN